LEENNGSDKAILVTQRPSYATVEGEGKAKVGDEHAKKKEDFNDARKKNAKPPRAKVKNCRRKPSTSRLKKERERVTSREHTIVFIYCNAPIRLLSGRDD